MLFQGRVEQKSKCCLHGFAGCTYLITIHSWPSHGNGSIHPRGPLTQHPWRQTHGISAPPKSMKTRVEVTTETLEVCQLTVSFPVCGHC